ncbi:hypothetical protein EVAR_55399_1 [Eumeta japonica]|uniref:Uncharacterized protein n=1 Tax=Eumeta variegata TaxID=151549 RepID=A0A4C1YTW7_EUMVA|nr:hypothetical protein EVAR_55399_1 [Eumeta japonica]
MLHRILQLPIGVKFRRGRASTKNDLRSGLLKFNSYRRNGENKKKHILADRRVTVRIKSCRHGEIKVGHERADHRPLHAPSVGGRSSPTRQLDRPLKDRTFILLCEGFVVEEHIRGSAVDAHVVGERP